MSPAGGGRYAHAVTSSWTPASISGLVGWWDASNAASITASGGLVSQWNDLSGAGNHLVQAAGAAQPTTGATTQNSLNVISFSGKNMDTASLAIAQPFTFYIVIEFAVASGFQGIVNAGAASRWFEFFSGVWQVNYGGSFAVGSVSASTPYATKVVANGASSSVTVNNAAPLTGTTGSNGISTFGVGRSDTFDFMNGWIAELFVVNTTVSGSDDTAAWSYLNAKWAVY